MGSYKVTISEILRKEIEVEANTAEEAKQKVHDAWDRGEYILTADDFREVEFEAEKITSEKLKVVLLEPGKTAIVTEIGSTLEDLQNTVGGFIEVGYFFDDPVCLICNEEGKLEGLPLNRGIYDDKEKMIDVIVGTAFICGCADENFRSLSSEEQKKYLDKFYYPEEFYLQDNKVKGKKIINSKFKFKYKDKVKIKKDITEEYLEKHGGIPFMLKYAGMEAEIKQIIEDDTIPPTYILNKTDFLWDENLLERM